MVTKNDKGLRRNDRAFYFSFREIYTLLYEKIIIQGGNYYERKKCTN